MNAAAILLINCPDHKGLASSISTFLYEHGGNILHLDQHQDNDRKLFFMRAEWSLDGFDLDAQTLPAQFLPIAERFAMQWRVAYSPARPAVALFVSRQLHCLADLLYRHHAGELPCRIAMVVSNHADAEPLATFYGIPFHHIKRRQRFGVGV